MKKFTIGLMVASLIFLGGCLNKSDNSKPVLKVNGRVITQNMYQDVYDQGIKRFTGGKEVDLSNPQYNFIKLINKNGTVNELIIRELIKYEADKRKITVTQEEVDSTIDEMIEKMGGKERFESILAMSKMDEPTFKKNIEFDLLKKKIVDSLVGDQEITDEEIKAFYEERKEKNFNHDEQVRASHILISASESDIKDMIKAETSDIKEEELNKKVQAKIAEANKKAQDILKKAKANPDKFAELASEYSDDTSSAKKGGDLGFFPKDNVMVEEFSKAAFATKPGKISDIVKTEFGYHIIKVTDRKEPGYTPFDEVKDKIETYLESKNKMDALKNLIETSRQLANIVYLEESYNPENIQKEIQEFNKKRQAQKPETEAKQEEEKTESKNSAEQDKK